MTSGTLILLAVVATIIVGSFLLVRHSRRLSARTNHRDESSQVSKGDSPGTER